LAPKLVHPKKVIIMRYLKKYAFVALLSARSNVAYTAEVMSRVVFMGVMLYIFSQLWHHAFSGSGSSRLGGFSIEQMLWYLTLTEAFMLSAPRVAMSVDLDVRSGAIVNYLQRPLSYPLYSLANNLGERLVRFLVNLLAGSVVTTILVGLPHFTFQGLLFFVVAITFAFIVDFLASFLVGLGAFWLEDTTGLFLIYWRLLVLLGGLLFPLTILPDNVRVIFECLPFAAIVYGPAKVLLDPDPLQFASVFARQLFGLALFGSLVSIVYGIASKRVFVNGG
jgi:ABC-2 type transport system permease protein